MSESQLSNNGLQVWVLSQYYVLFEQGRHGEQVMSRLAIGVYTSLELAKSAAQSYTNVSLEWTAGDDSINTLNNKQLREDGTVEFEIDRFTINRSPRDFDDEEYVNVIKVG